MTTKAMRLSTGLALILLTSLVSGCGGGGKSEAVKEPTQAEVQEILAKQITVASSLPAAPDATASKASVAGVDTNSNGVRDDVEITTAQVLFDGPGGISAADYNQVLDIIKYIQPSETTKTIDQRNFYCQYRALPEAVRSRLSMQMLINMVTDTRTRKQAYQSQSINTSGSLGAEYCGQGS